ncbi:MAG: hypothetical protein KC777_06745 [Cyanobacteria bacterium HKST-UBA02]|nr:hypothetical protein [Cyanobacteria bacterium HKST-UBA02]
MRLPDPRHSTKEVEFGMRKFLCHVGGTVGAMLGFMILAALTGHLQELIQGGSLVGILVIIGMVGLATATVVNAFEKSSGETRLHTSIGIGAVFVTVIVIAACIGVVLFGPDKFADVDWLGTLYLLRSTVIVGGFSGAVYYLSGRLTG